MKQISGFITVMIVVTLCILLTLIPDDLVLAIGIGLWSLSLLFYFQLHREGMFKEHNILQSLFLCVISQVGYFIFIERLLNKVIKC